MKKIGFIFIFIVILICRADNYLFADDVSEMSPQEYNEGVDFYTQEDYNKAIDKFFKALNTEDKKLERWANYNLGNAHFQEASKQEAADLESALKMYESALEFFRRAIELDGSDIDAKYNYE